jgi:hypothetical protein
MVTLAIIRTVASVTVVIPSVCWDVAHAVIQRDDGGRCWTARIPDAVIAIPIETATDNRAATLDR